MPKPKSKLIERFTSEESAFSQTYSPSMCHFKKNITSTQTIYVKITIQLEGPQVSDASLEHIPKGMPELKSLSLISTKNVTTNGLQKLFPATDENAHWLGNLERITLTDITAVTDVILGTINEDCYNLKILNLSGNKNLSQETLDKSMHAAAWHSTVEHLGFSGTSISDSGLSGIAQKCKEVQSISLSNCNHITVAGISELCNTCPKLRAIECQNCPNAPTDEIKRLQIKFPHVDIDG